MRIIAGEFRHRTLLSPPEGASTRPIPDRVKESIFNLLRGHFEGATVLDAFAGVGGMGLEAVSRGASKVVFVEKDRRVAETLERNIRGLGVASRTEIVTGDALGPGALARCPRPVHIAFFDPPYDLVRDRVGFKRFKAQFEAVVRLLDDTGFAIFRTPWPFVHEETPEEPSEPELLDRYAHKRSDRRGQRRRGSRTMREMEDLERFGETIDPFEDEGADAEPDADDTPAPKGRTFPADMAMEGAAGPETHAYGSTAVHLYMRARPTPVG